MEKLDPKAKWLEFYSLFPFGFIFIAIIFIPLGMILAALFFENQPLLKNIVAYGTFPFMLLVWGIISYFLSKKAYNNSGFELAKEGIKFRKGILKTRRYFIPYSKIKTVNYQKGAELTYARFSSLSGFRRLCGALMGLYSLYINTERTISEEIEPTSKLYTKEIQELQGLNKNQVEEIYQKILERSNAQSLRERRERELSKLATFAAESPFKTLALSLLFFYIGGHFFSLLIAWRHWDIVRSLWGLNGFQAWKEAELIWFLISLGLTLLVGGGEIISARYKKDFASFNLSPRTLGLILLSSLIVPFLILWLIFYLFI